MAKNKSYKRTPEQHAAWEHNGLIGACWMARKNAERIVKAPTATRQVKNTAGQIVSLTYQLAQELKESING